ncbi:MAG TPA: tetratricopeptide repeat protein [Candidatus Limnocylindria bacterium]|nr:tetratricopeptide repeat protein [Candidatus Limnocylindria bacterium]
MLPTPDNENRSLISRPGRLLEKAESGVKRVLAEMVADVLGLAPVEDAELLFQTGASYHRKQDYGEAVKYLRKAAQANHARAQYILGLCCHEGTGTPSDNVEAVTWFTRAATQGHADGQHSLGFCYASGLGVRQDHAQSVGWYRKAAEQGNAQAQNNLAKCYQNGCGVPQNYDEAVKWFLEAARQGNTESQYGLAYCYIHGQGVTQSYVWRQPSGTERQLNRDTNVLERPWR